ncbi:MAG: hypothetical protein JNN20_13715 [Betaproteobacteria bacterium]|nr:hypothetical protein [Betaproteobacteria bacterium]
MRLALRGCAVVSLLVSLNTAAHVPTEETTLASPYAIQGAQSGQKLRVSSRREGIYPYLPGASYVISIRVPEQALREGWRCCWIDAFSRETANRLSAQYGKSVIGNEVDLVVDAAQAESSLRQITPDLFEGYVRLASIQRAGSHAARLYVHLYRTDGVSDTAPAYEYGDPRFSVRTSFVERGRYRYARNFLDEPVLTVRFAYPPNASSGRSGAPPSQLPNYAPPRN